MEAFKGIIFDSHSAVFRCPQGAITCGETLRLSVFVSAALNPARVTLRLWENEAERLLPMEKQRFFTHTPYGDFLQEFSLNVSCETICSSDFFALMFHVEHPVGKGSNVSRETMHAD